MPPEQAMAAAAPMPADPMMPAGPDMGMAGPPMPDEDAMLQMLMQAVAGKWQSEEAQIAGEKGVLIQTLMQMAMPTPAFGPQDMVEGAPGTGAMPA